MSSLILLLKGEGYTLLVEERNEKQEFLHLVRDRQNKLSFRKTDAWNKQWGDNTSACHHNISRTERGNSSIWLKNFCRIPATFSSEDQPVFWNCLMTDQHCFLLDCDTNFIPKCSPALFPPWFSLWTLRCIGQRSSSVFSIFYSIYNLFKPEN